MKKAKYIEFNLDSREELSSRVKDCIKNANSPDIVMDLSSLNILDAAKIMVLSSAYQLGKFPDGKIKCKLSDSHKCNFLNPFITKNLELV